jgi:hypothetical protein
MRMLRLQNQLKLSFLFCMRLELLHAYPNLLYVHSKYSGSCSIYIMKVVCVARGASSSKRIQNENDNLNDFRA